MLYRTKMLATIVMLYSWQLLMPEVLALPPQLSIYDKFTQNDYKIKFEHMDVDHYNEHFVKEMNIVTFKYNRTYTAFNGSFEMKIDLNNEIEVVIQAYKFTSNEYRLFPLRFQVNGCLALSRNLIGIADFTKCGNFSGCPLKKVKPIYICKWAPDESKYPPFIPNGRYMIEMQFMYRSTEVAVIKAYAEIYRPISIPN